MPIQEPKAINARLEIRSTMPPKRLAAARSATQSTAAINKVVTTWPVAALRLALIVWALLHACCRAIAAMRHWRFRPATKYGKPVVFPATIDLDFRLR